jgi:hypothetical protein
MDGLKSMLAWVAGWLLTTAAIGAGLVIYTLARGGTVHQTPTCGGGSDANLYSLGLTAASLATIVALAWWALGATSLRARWARVILVAIASPPIAFAGIFLVGSLFTLACTFGAPIL